MKAPSAFSLTSLALSCVALTFVPFARQAAAEPKPHKWEFRVETNASEQSLKELSEGGWDFGGYMGLSDLGETASVTLWKRPKK